jgi:ABC-type antimicrobial peptide transport system permease subunit
LYTEYDRAFTYGVTPSNRYDLIGSLYTNQGQAVVEGERKGYVPDIIFSGRKIGVTYNDSLSFNPATKYNTYLDVIVSEALRDEVSVRVGQPLQLKMSIRNPITGASSSEDYICKARALVNKVPGFFYSSYRFAASGSTVLVTVDQFFNATIAAAKKINYQAMNELDERKYEKVYVKLTKSGFARKPDIMNEMKSRVDPDFSGILDIESAVASTTTASTVILAFYNVVAVIAVMLCFFTLSLSFEANVRENSWEFGVIRAVGLSVSALIRSYIYEALCLVASSLLCGFVIGVTIALTLTAQFNLFLEMPFQFDFPYILFFSLIAMALVVAVVGSWIPARILRKKEIAIVLRGL